MSHMGIRTADRPEFDQILQDIADYVCDYDVQSAEARRTAMYCFMDSISCALMAMRFPECVKLLGPIVPGASLSGGSRVPATNYELDPAQAAFNFGVQIRYLGFNDTWLAAEWGHPSDNLGAILMVADYVTRQRLREGHTPMTIRKVLDAMIKAYEIQGVLALENSFNQMGLDHVLLVRVASTAVCTWLMGGDRDDVLNALSNAWVDGGGLRVHRHAPNTGTRQGWAAGDACRRAVQLSLLALKGEMGYPSALTAENWGFYDALFAGEAFKQEREFGSYVMENVLFKIAYPAEFHAQTAVECALKLHEQVKDKLDQIDRVAIETQEAGLRIVDKTGVLDNYADRDHCIQYMVAVALIFGEVSALSYKEKLASDPRIDSLRQLMEVTENSKFTEAYYDPEKRAIGNAIQVFFNDGSSTDRVEIEFPLGHRRRRDEGIPILRQKFQAAVTTQYSKRQAKFILDAFDDQGELEHMAVTEFVERLFIQ